MHDNSGSLLVGGVLAGLLPNNALRPSSGGSAVVAGSVVATLPSAAGVFEHEETLAAVGVTAGMKVLLSLAPHADSDENNELALDMRGLAGEAGTGAITVRMAFGSLTSGPIRINYLAA